MWMQWGEQREYIMKSWNVGWFIGTLFVIINLLGQLIPCGMILTRKKTDIACGILVFIIAFQVNLPSKYLERLFKFPRRISENDSFSPFVFFIVNRISNYLGTALLT
jgi:hypothetical protein